jgi:four helix bundle protein
MRARGVEGSRDQGVDRGTRPDYIRFLWIANGAVAELDTQLLIAKQMRYSQRDEMDHLIGDLSEIERILRALIRSLQAKDDG